MHKHDIPPPSGYRSRLFFAFQVSLGGFFPVYYPVHGVATLDSTKASPKRYLCLLVVFITEKAGWAGCTRSRQDPGASSTTSINSNSSSSNNKNVAEEFLRVARSRDNG